MKVVLAPLEAGAAMHEALMCSLALTLFVSPKKYVGYGGLPLLPRNDHVPQ